MKIMKAIRIWVLRLKNLEDKHWQIWTPMITSSFNFSCRLRSECCWTSVLISWLPFTKWALRCWICLSLFFCETFRKVSYCNIYFRLSAIKEHGLYDLFVEFIERSTYAENNTTRKFIGLLLNETSERPVSCHDRVGTEIILSHCRKIYRFSTFWRNVSPVLLAI